MVGCLFYEKNCTEHKERYMIATKKRRFLRRLMSIPVVLFVDEMEV